MSKLLYILLALVILLILITVHEFGHYCAGKMLGFKINEFSIGFGPAIFKRKRKDGEQFSVRLLPLGGYCAFEGEDDDGNDKPGSFNTMAAWKRVIVLLAGVTFNFLFGVLTAVIYLMVNGYATVQISQIVTQKNVQTMGFMENDIVVAVNGKTVEAYRNFSSLIKKFKEDENFEVTVERDGKKIKITTAKQRFDPFYFVSMSQDIEGKLFVKDADGTVKNLSLSEFSNGITGCDTSIENKDNAGKGQALKAYLSSVYTDESCQVSYASKIDELLSGDTNNGVYPVITYSPASVGIGIIQQNVFRDYNFFECVAKAWPFCFYLCGLIITSLVGLFTGAVSVSEAGGTITAISQIAEIGEMGMGYLLLLIPMLCMNLALFNVLPIPSLDGARTIFVLIEIIFKKPVPRQIEGWIHTIGLFILLALVVFLDINHFFLASAVLQL